MTCEASRERVAPNGVAPPGAQAAARDGACRPSTRWGCSATGPAALTSTQLLTGSSPGLMASGFEQFDRIAVRIFDLNLFAARTDLHFIPKTQAGLFQVINVRSQTLNLKKHTVPSAGLLWTAVRHRPGPGCARAAQD